MLEFGYKNMFNGLSAHTLEPEDLNRLATIMSERLNFPGTIFRAIRNAGNSAIRLFASIGLIEARPEPKPIPAGYTYLSQFIVHDISHIDHTERHIREDLPFENIFTSAQIENIGNKRRPGFDLETIYGHEKPTNPDEIPRRELIQDHPLKLPLLKLGRTQEDLTGREAAGRRYPCDLLREDGLTKAKIVDSRNDENLVLAQTQVAFTKFHNAMVVSLSSRPEYKNEAGGFKTDELFGKARELTIRYYQTIILTDFLPRIIPEPVLNDVRQKVNTAELFYQPIAGDMYIPLEFTLGAFRFGHSMIREEYKLNRLKPKATVDELFSFTGGGNFGGAAARLSLPSNWIIDWNFFYDIAGSEFNVSNTIDTNLPSPLLEILPKRRGFDIRANSLAALDLYRGRQFGLSAGQDIARQIPGAIIPTATEIGILIGSKKPENRYPIQQISPEGIEEIKDRLRDVFSEKSPLWFYILAEAEIQAETATRTGIGIENAGKLGAVGSRIVAETVLQLLYKSEYSILQSPDWEPNDDFLLKSDRNIRYAGNA